MENNNENNENLVQPESTNESVLNEMNSNQEIPTMVDANTNTISEPVSPVVPDEPKKKKSKLGVIIVILLLIIVVCLGVYYFYFNKDKNNNDTKGLKENTVIPVSLKAEYAIKNNGINDFDLYFMQYENKNGNFVYSPLSIKYALEMLSEGANGESKTQLDTIIGNYVARNYTNSENMSFANALFVKDSFKDNVKSSYVDTIKTKYNAEVIYDSFATPTNLNTWVSNKTFNMIPNLFEDVSDKDYILANALAIDMEWINKIRNEGNSYIVEFEHENYYDWIDALVSSGYSGLNFDAEETKEVATTSLNEVKSVEIGAVSNKYDIVKTLGEDNIRNTVRAEFEKNKSEYYDEEKNCYYFRDYECSDFESYLNDYVESIKANYNYIDSSTDFKFLDSDDIKVFAKDLKTYNGTTLEYIGIMPKKVKLNEYIKNLDASKINNVINNLKEIKIDSFEEGYITEIHGLIPMFEFSNKIDLIDNLTTLGITDIFDSTRSDLSNLTTSKGSFIEEAKQEVKIDFSNEGIKAAAAIELGGSGDANGGWDYKFEVPIKKIDLTFDSPFMFMVIDKNTKEVWFAGKVYEPTKCLESENCFSHDYDD